MVKRGKFIVIEGNQGSGKTTMAKSIVNFLCSRSVPAIFTAEPTKVSTYRNFFGAVIRALIHKKQPTLYEISYIQQAAKDFLFGGRRKGTKIQRAFRRSVLGIVEKLRNIKIKKLSEREWQTLYIADRYFHLIEVVLPALERGEWVVCDRYEISTWAHYLAQTGSKKDILAALQFPVLNGVYVRPNKVIFLDVSPEVAIKRQRASGKALDRYEVNERQVKRLCEAYRNVARKLICFEVSDPRHNYPIITIDADKSLQSVGESVVKVIEEMI